ncbi:hypothetical protein [Methanococcoides alaskense]|uniref:Uncharacterized protein n=1 Tax=Methanococcoides alaskense TaxID=325778 RepID=A0AA90U1K5_9EURY|nr:hypothetical protein [Methanococcoides alaskense]MDA0524284.1 hypothetical protein [Methanococcoides alaskense]MDR6223765.1 hypothetical protein [Methanococcoides alaskense]
MTETGYYCPSCGKGVKTLELFNTNATDEFISETIYYSCGHKHMRDEIKVKAYGYAEISRQRLKRGKTEQGKAKIEIEERLQHNDLDNSNEPVRHVVCKDRTNRPTSCFQVVKYYSGTIKHVDCKTKKCDNEWRYNQETSIECSFHFDDSSGYKITCLKCGANIDTNV